MASLGAFSRFMPRLSMAGRSPQLLVKLVVICGSNRNQANAQLGGGAAPQFKCQRGTAGGRGDIGVTGVQTCALPISMAGRSPQLLVKLVVICGSNRNQANAQLGGDALQDFLQLGKLRVVTQQTQVQRLVGETQRENPVAQTTADEGGL